MPINPDAVGVEGEPVETLVDARRTPCSTPSASVPARDELAFTTENTNGVDQQVLPTFPVVIGWGGGSAMATIGTFNPAMLVHGEQASRCTAPIPVEGTATRARARSSASTTRARPRSWSTRDRPTVLERRAAVHQHVVGVHPRRGRLGRRPRAVRARATCRPSASPTTASRYQTSPDQALLYRLSGDRNPLHSDPAFAAMGGFDRPILHGLCTYGFTGRALLHTLCGGDPARFQHMEGRFSSPVMPGEALTSTCGSTGDGEAVFTTAGRRPPRHRPGSAQVRLSQTTS